MRHLFIADLHLSVELPKITKIFYQFLRESLSPGDKLYILGDLFESWVGDDDHTPFNSEIIAEISRATQKGIYIYLMQGNRDFLLGRKFCQLSGCILLPDEYVITLANQPCLLMHGDTLCTKDIAYMNFRRKARNKLYQKLFLMLSLKKRQAIADKFRQKSQKYTATTASHIMDVCQSDVIAVMKKHQCLHLIHGHTHRPNTHHFEIDNKPASRTVLAPWHDAGYVLIYDQQGNQETLKLSN